MTSPADLLTAQRGGRAGGHSQESITMSLRQICFVLGVFIACAVGYMAYSTVIMGGALMHP